MTIVPILCLFFWHEGACQGMRVHEEELRLHYLQIRLTLVLWGFLLKKCNPRKYRRLQNGAATRN
jgi:hypothetical protein